MSIKLSFDIGAGCRLEADINDVPVSGLKELMAVDVDDIGLAAIRCAGLIIRKHVNQHGGPEPDDDEVAPCRAEVSRCCDHVQDHSGHQRRR